MVDSIDANRFKVKLNYLSQINEVEFIVAELLDHPVYTTIYAYIKLIIILLTNTIISPLYERSKRTLTSFTVHLFVSHREQLLSVDMEKRSVRELTLQLYPHKPVYKRREKDEIRGWEEVFPDGMPWCMAPGGRALPEIIDGFNGIDYDYTLYKELCGSEDRPKTLFTEDVWSMNERKRLFKEERKKEIEKSVLKGGISR